MRQLDHVMQRIDTRDITFAQDFVHDPAAAFAKLLEEDKIRQLGVSHLGSLLVAMS
jgi:hypothetical protein